MAVVLVSLAASCVLGYLLTDWLRIVSRRILLPLVLLKFRRRWPLTQHAELVIRFRATTEPARVGWEEEPE